MEKNAYETYEFLPSTNAEADTNQFFVLQDDGTILSVSKEIQYITQVEDNKDASNLNTTEVCTPVFDTQQYYVEFEGNSTEMISLNDQFAITNGENNAYANSYLIQPESTSTPQEMEIEAVIDPQKLDAQQIQQLNIEAFNGSKPTTDLTEITLTDEQYQILEQKGWLLLESNDKIFVLNTLGLHDITANEKLVQRLKSELLESSDPNNAIGQLKIESISSIFPNDSTEVNTQEQSNAVEYFATSKYFANNKPLQQPVANEEQTAYIISKDVDEKINEIVNPNKNAVTDVPVTINYVLNAEKDKDKLPQKGDSIKIKTKYIFKDIPDKIFLGKTVNGKKLFAKVKKKNNNQDVYSKTIEKKPHYSSLLDAAMFTNLIQDTYRNMPNASRKCVEFAEAVVYQLMRLPNITDSIVNNDLVITKIIVTHTANGKEVTQPTIVTGFMKAQGNDYVFAHTPSLLRDLLSVEDNDKKTKTDTSSSSPREKTAKGLIDLFHIHISEARFTDKAPETSIHLTKRKIPLDVLNDAKKRHPNPAYACGSCGGVFKSERLLKDHQDDECIDVEDELTIDYTDEINNQTSTLYTVAENGKEKVYTCTLCETKFTRLYYCKKHLKAHQAGVEKKLKVYKCKMCPNSYFHSSSLSKHIVKSHIQMKIK